MTQSYGNQKIPASQMDYIILAWNNLGMHCDQQDYSYFCVLPPANTLYVQVLDRSGHGGSGPITKGITVSYAFANKSNTSLHTNFWTYAPQFGWDVATNVGITGTLTAGNMVPSGDNLSWTAQYIPISPYDDDGTWDPYGAATITVKDSRGNVLQTANVVAPVSTEMNCANCHGTSSLDPTLTPSASILYQHDVNSGTTLYTDWQAGTVHLCGSCHKDNALGTAGVSGVEELSYAIHNFHSNKMTFTTTAANTTPDCYNCHPGPVTQCLRGIMHRAGKECANCHGDVGNVAASIASGRTSWANEPTCGAADNWSNGNWGGACHDSAHYSENSKTLYRNSVLNNSPSRMMNGKIYCEGCHNSTHAELVSGNAADPTIPTQFQGDTYWIHSCAVCHQWGDGSKIHQ